jgi:molybdenum cofactor cytidylyltransferase
MSAIAGIVLAAGRGTRMGGPNKLLARDGDRPLVRAAVETALAAGLDPVIVVTGHETEAVEAALADLPVLLVRNDDYAQGQATSLQAGLVALPFEAGAFMVLLGDMPRVKPATIARLIEAHADLPDLAAIVPVHAGEPGNPVLLTRALVPALMRLDGDKGARAILRGRPDVLELEIDDPGIRLDIDTPQALKALD